MDGPGRSFRKHGEHAKAKPFNRAKKVLRNLKMMAGRVFWGVERKLDDAAFKRDTGQESNKEREAIMAKAARGPSGFGDHHPRH